MKALVWNGPRSLAVQDLSKPPIAPGEALIEVVLASVCGSDILGYLGQNRLRRSPLIMGHEFCGRVVGTAADVTGLRVGSRVAVNPLLSDGTCAYCRAGRENLCTSRAVLGAHRPGAFAEFVSTPATACYQLADDVDDTHGALVEPLACAVRAVDLAGIGPGHQVLILGAGPIGLLTIAVARRAGAEAIMVSETKPFRRGLARRFGATEAADPLACDIVDWVRNRTDGLGCNEVIDAVGLSVTRDQAVRAVRAGGHVVLVGLHDDNSVLSGRQIVTQEATISGSFAYTRANFAAALALVTDDFLSTDGSWLVTRPLAEGPAIFDQLANGSLDAGKVLLRP